MFIGKPASSHAAVILC